MNTSRIIRVWLRLTLCLLCASHVCLLRGQDDSLLSEGKMWIYRIHDIYEDPMDSYFCYYVKGDSIVDGNACKKVWLRSETGPDTLHSVLYEANGKVHQKELFDGGEDDWFLLYDFGLEEGDEVTNRWGDRLYVGKKDSVSVSGKKHCVLHLGVAGEEFHVNEITWIDGIGSNEGIYYSPVEMPFNHVWRIFQSCFDGNEKIYGGGGSEDYIWNYSCVKYWSLNGTKVSGTKEVVQFERPDYKGEFVNSGGKQYISVQAWGDVKGYPIGIREDNGRVLANLEDYKAHIEAQGGNASQIPYAVTDDGEVVLYDYNMKEGDAYPSGITVETKEYVTLKNMEPRRCLTLSNGMVLIEGLGCINSPGMLLDYLNPPSDREDDFVYLEGFSSTYGNDQSVFEPEWTFSPDGNGIGKVWWQNQTGDSGDMKCGDGAILYDLQGRRISRRPEKGMYIEDGQVKVK